MWRRVTNPPAHGISDLQFGVGELKWLFKVKQAKSGSYAEEMVVRDMLLYISPVQWKNGLFNPG